MENKEILKELNNLIETVRDGQEGYRLASEDVDDAELKAIFSRFSQQRATFAGTLQQYQHDLGKSDAECDSSAKGSLHRSWMNIKSALSSKDREAILKECERGEEYAVKQFRKALECDLPDYIASTVTRQLSDIEAARGRVEALQNASV